MERALTLWSTLTIASTSINNKLPPVMHKVNPADRDKKVRSTLFDELRWGKATNSFAQSCRNIKSQGWVTIKGEAMAFAKVNNCCAGIQEDISSIQVNDNNHSNLLEASDSENEGMDTAWRVESDMEEGPYNGVRGFLQGDEPKMSSSSESSNSEELSSSHDDDEVEVLSD